MLVKDDWKPENKFQYSSFPHIASSTIKFQLIKILNHPLMIYIRLWIQSFILQLIIFILATDNWPL
jgi:hypothetical protein